MPVFGTTLTDLQQGRLLQREQLANERQGMRNFIAQQSQQRSNERLGNRELDIFGAQVQNQDRQFRDELGFRREALSQEGRIFGSEMDLRKQAIEMAKEQFGDELELRNRQMKLAEESQVVQNQIAQKTARNNSLLAMGQFLSSLNSGLSSQAKTTAINQAMSTLGRLRTSLAPIMQAEQEIQSMQPAAQSVVDEAIRTQVDASWIPFYYGSKQARREQVSRTGQLNAGWGNKDLNAWFTTNYPEYAQHFQVKDGKVVRSGSASVTDSAGVTRNITPGEQLQQQIRNEMQAVESQMNQLVRENPMAAPEVNKIITEARTILQGLGMDVDDILPQNSGGFVPASSPTSRVQGTPDVNQPSGGYQEGQTATDPSTGRKIIFRNGQWQDL